MQRNRQQWLSYQVNFFWNSVDSIMKLDSFNFVFLDHLWKYGEDKIIEKPEVPEIVKLIILI